jgi:hypothetical protein
LQPSNMWPILATLGEVFRGMTSKGCFKTVYVKDVVSGSLPFNFYIRERYC